GLHPARFQGGEVAPRPQQGGHALTIPHPPEECYSILRESLSGVNGLETVTHHGPSTIGIDTIYLSKGQIPERFLRGAGVQETFITYMKSLVVNPIEYYSCFISYSSKDQDFANRLYADLHTENVRCWFAPEHLKIGDRFRARIDEAIRIHDKLLLVLSKDSIESPWVEDEVEAAFEKERQQNKLVLFPIRLDDAVMTASQAWAARVRRIVHMGDFTPWKDHDQYRTAFTRLLRDLKADDKTKSAS
ncbi:MAG: toll/interleukin-1 receptor domain-containing protein, partial [Acidobacteria bacterium]|nr:toll/interleukin-1 receptor domain-containing protein [Acidobacteriota bacterium]